METDGATVSDSVDDGGLRQNVVEELMELASGGAEKAPELVRRVGQMTSTTAPEQEQWYLVPADERHRVAAFREGLILCETAKQFSPTVKALKRDFKERYGRPPSLILPLPGGIIGQIAQVGEIQTRAANDDGQRAEGLKRQAELRDMIMKAVHLEASDIHLNVQPTHTTVQFRVYGQLKAQPTYSVEAGKEIIRAALAVSDDTVTSHDRAHQHGALTHQGVTWLPNRLQMVRLASNPQSEGRMALVMRLKYRSLSAERDIAELGYMEAQLRDLALMRRRTNGLYILSGKVSSGKSTTLERVMNQMYHEKKGAISIFTIEEPIELNIPGAVQIAITASDEKGRGQAFQDAIKAALRSDPNVIVVGEIRDKGTAQHTIQGAMTGHAMWTTLHASRALSILDRLLDLEVDPWKITDPGVTRGLIYQRLLGTLCPKCKVKYREAVREGRLDRQLARDVCNLLQMRPEDLFIGSEDGCEHCLYGRNGRTVVAEVVRPDKKLLGLYRMGERELMTERWLADVEDGGHSGRPVIYNSLLKVAAGVADINEVEEEVDLVASFKSDYPQLVSKLRAEVDKLLGRRKRQGEAAA